jgi:TusA-related sulfurtransferase
MPAPTSLPVPAIRLVLRGVQCPINFVKTKIALEQIAVGECVEVVVDGGEPSRNVPRSARLEGHEVLSDVAGADGAIVLVIRRGR